MRILATMTSPLDCVWCWMVCGVAWRVRDACAGTVWCMQGSKDERYLVTGSADCTTKVWHLLTGSCIKSVKAYTDTVQVRPHLALCVSHTVRPTCLTRLVLVGSASNPTGCRDRHEHLCNRRNGWTARGVGIQAHQAPQAPTPTHKTQEAQHVQRDASRPQLEGHAP